jgi:hypothetical protein
MTLYQIYNDNWIQQYFINAPPSVELNTPKVVFSKLQKFDEKNNSWGFFINERWKFNELVPPSPQFFKSKS